MFCIMETSLEEAFEGIFHSFVPPLMPLTPQHQLPKLIALVIKRIPLFFLTPLEDKVYMKKFFAGKHP